MINKLPLEHVQKLKAASLKKEFAVFGHFYNRRFKERVIPCRETLEIISKKDVPFDIQEIPQIQPELIAIMMNPGSSRPVNKEYVPKVLTQASDIKIKRHIVEAVPDNAQYQIMRFMLLNGWSHARILNLSDLREPKSAVFMKTWPTLSDSHSVFSKLRKKSLDLLLGNPQMILLAWSQEVSLLPLAQIATNSIRPFNTVGLPRGEGLYAYPSPMLQKHKEAWLANIYAQMNNETI